MAFTVTKLLAKARPPVTTVEKAPKSKTVVPLAATNQTLPLKPAYTPTPVSAAQLTRALPGSGSAQSAQTGKTVLTGGANGNNGTSATGVASYVTYY